MTDTSIDSLIHSAATWVIYFASKTQQPLFRFPCLHFSVDHKGLAELDSVRFVPVTDAVSLSPEAVLGRAKRRRREASTYALVLAYAIDADGEIHSDAIAPPPRFLLYVYVPSDRGPTAFERRIVCVDDNNVDIQPDDQLPFDNRSRLELRYDHSSSTAPVFTDGGDRLH